MVSGRAVESAAEESAANHGASARMAMRVFIALIQLLTLSFDQIRLTESCRTYTAFRCEFEYFV